MSLFQSGHAEAFKGGYHAALGLLAAGACVYNVLAWIVRGPWSKRRHPAVIRIAPRTPALDAQIAEALALGRSAGIVR